MRFAFDLAAALDAALDQVANGEAHVGFEGVDAGVVQAVAQRRHVGRRFHVDARDRRAVERALVDVAAAAATPSARARSASAARM